MSDIFKDFIEKKKAESKFITLEDGEVIIIKKLKNIKLLNKIGFGGDEQEVIRLVCDVDTKEGLREKFFDNGTQRWSQELTDKGIQIGSGFSITRTGLKTKTRYTVSDATNTKAPVPTQPAS